MEICRKYCAVSSKHYEDEKYCAIGAKTQGKKKIRAGGTLGYCTQGGDFWRPVEKGMEGNWVGGYCKNIAPMV